MQVLVETSPDGAASRYDLDDAGLSVATKDRITDTDKLCSLDAQSCDRLDRFIRPLFAFLDVDGRGALEVEAGLDTNSVTDWASVTYVSPDAAALVPL